MFWGFEGNLTNGFLFFVFLIMSIGNGIGIPLFIQESYFDRFKTQANI